MTLIDPHLDVDQVSAAVDGERDPAVAAHLLVCLSCREQVDAWRRVLRSLGEVPALPADLLDRMVERSLGEPVPSADSTATVRSSDDVGRSHRDRRSTPRRRRRLPELPSVAALLIVAVLVTAAVVGLRHDGGSGTTGSGASATAALPTVSRPSAAPGTTGGSTTTPTRSFAGTAQLTAELHRLAPTLRATAQPAPAPCLRQATTVATHDPVVAGRAVWYDEAIDLGGVAGRVFVFGGDHDFVAVVVRSDTCSLLETLLF